MKYSLIKNYLIIPAVLIILLSGCSHKNIATQLPTFEHSSTAKLLINKHWLEGDVLLTEHPDTTVRNITLQFPAPERDDILILREDGTYLYDEGASRDKPNDKRIFSHGTWQVVEQNKRLLLTANGSINTYDILEITDSTLVLKLNITQRSRSYAYTLYFNMIEGDEGSN
ncbi:MAG: hypothetical protein KA713_01355 [Chryseotalea sp. WA131a]|jgi:hypothetical protein|nr:MAG: hypothetical protein KA713_01355 [Chryseotalea sp. WA131a]